MPLLPLPTLHFQCFQNPFQVFAGVFAQLFPQKSLFVVNPQTGFSRDGILQKYFINNDYIHIYGLQCSILVHEYILHQSNQGHQYLPLFNIIL